MSKLLTGFVSSALRLRRHAPGVHLFRFAFLLLLVACNCELKSGCGATC
jgi:hypothetical protein